MEILLAAFGQLDFHIVHEGDGCFVIGLVMSNVVEVDQVRLMCAEKTIARQAVFDLFQNLCYYIFFTSCGNDLGIPATGNATKNLFP